MLHACPSVHACRGEFRHSAEQCGCATTFEQSWTCQNVSQTAKFTGVRECAGACFPAQRTALFILMFIGFKGLYKLLALAGLRVIHYNESLAILVFLDLQTLLNSTSVSPK